LLSAPLLRPILAALNHVLAQQTWASDRLRVHAGRRVRIDLDGPLGRLSVQTLITDAGHLAVCPEAGREDSADVTLRLRLSSESLTAWWSRGIDGLTGHLRIEGDVMLAATIAEMARHLRWDVEEDLSRVVGDALAYRTVSEARARWQSVQGMAQRGLQSAVRHWVDDPAGVVDRPSAQLLEQRLQDLERSLDGLERQWAAGGARPLQSASKSA
jgi:ubiquinone biosynthesis protein UbiJ